MTRVRAFRRLINKLDAIALSVTSQVVRSRLQPVASHIRPGFPSHAGGSTEDTGHTKYPSLYL